MKFSWIAPDRLRQVTEVLQQQLGSWDAAFDATDALRPSTPPPDLSAAEWPHLAEHIARAARVEDAVRLQGPAGATARFGASPHPVERATLFASGVELATPAAEGEAVIELLLLPIDEYLTYGHFLTRLVELRAADDPEGAIDVYERFLGAATRVQAFDGSWPERLRLCRDGLANLYVRAGHTEQAEELYDARFAEETDATIAISAARAYLENGQVSFSIRWLERGAERSAKIGRADLATKLAAKAQSLRSRTS